MQLCSQYLDVDGSPIGRRQDSNSRLAARHTFDCEVAQNIAVLARGGRRAGVGKPATERWERSGGIVECCWHNPIGLGQNPKHKATK